MIIRKNSWFVICVSWTSFDKQVDIFKQIGPVKSFRLVFDKETGRTKGYGFCEYHGMSVQMRVSVLINRCV